MLLAASVIKQETANVDFLQNQAPQYHCKREVYYIYDMNYCNIFGAYLSIRGSGANILFCDLFFSDPSYGQSGPILQK